MDAHFSHSKKLRPVMFAGTGSDVGKSVIAAGFCRIFRQDGFSPAPFKAQNMALNSFVTPEGGEIGRSQAVQAEAAGTLCHTDMNPILLKPSAGGANQLILHGKMVSTHRPFDPVSVYVTEVRKAFDRLAFRYNPVVLEGAGSVAELNLKENDIVNFPMARYAGAAVILVANIDRGGIFANLYGTMLLLAEEDRKRVAGIIINKFRGEVSLFDSGKKIVEELCGVPVLGVVPFLDGLDIEEEDSVTLPVRHTESRTGRLNIAVVLTGHVSNITDFRGLGNDPRIRLYYTRSPEAIAQADIVLIPGSKSTVADLMEMRKNGTADAVIAAAAKGKTVFGICGGYQMMGMEVSDPQGTEGISGSVPGLGLLPVYTVIGGEKTVRQVRFGFGEQANTYAGYEIHLGQTERMGGDSLFNLSDGTPEGCRCGERIMGTYIHGVLDHPDTIDRLVAPYTNEPRPDEIVGPRELNEKQYDRLADHLRRHVDVEKIYRIQSEESE